MQQWHEAERSVSAALHVDVVLDASLAAAARRAGTTVPAPFRPPHPYLSLTHSGDVVVGAAVGARHRERVRGLGVDYEPATRHVDARAGRLFLDELEQARIDALPQEERGPARLVHWTIKEAAYKATPDNVHHTVAAYRVEDDHFTTGTVWWRDGGRFRHVVVPFAGGVLAVAVLDEGGEESARVAV